MYDIFYISKQLTKTDEFLNLKSRFPIIKLVDSFDAARNKCVTNFFWVIWDDLMIEDSFKFDYVPDAWSLDYIHTFLNRASYDGVVLVPKTAPVSKKEIEYRFFVKTKPVEIIASLPKRYEIFTVDTYEEYLHAIENSKTELFWATSRNIKIKEDFDFDFYFTHENLYDRHENHAFIHSVDDEEYYNGLFLLSTRNKVSKKEIDFRFLVNRKEWNIVASGPLIYDKFAVSTYSDYVNAFETSNTEMFWIIPEYVSIHPEFKFDAYFTHDSVFERGINHSYLNGNYYDGITLCSKQSQISKREFDYMHIINKKEVPIIASDPKKYDVVFISYNEPNADLNYENLKKVVPNAKRVHGVQGIHAAHIEAAKLCSTEMFWIVDGDATIYDGFTFNYQVPRWDKETVHVWRSINPVNDLIYGYGGIKLFPRMLTLGMNTLTTDMTTSISKKFKAISDVSNITSFNTDPFNTWKSAFRECVKLSSRIIDRQKDDETLERLTVWKTVGHDRQYGKYAIDGAIQGELFGTTNRTDPDKIKLINDFKWLEEIFNEQYS